MIRVTNLCPEIRGRAIPAALAALVGLATLLSGLSPARAAGPLRVESSDRSAVRLSLETGDIEWRTHELRGGALALAEPRIEGFAATGEPAAPMVPVAGGWLVVPPGTRPVLHTVSTRWDMLDGRRLMVAPTPVLRPARDGLAAEPVDEILLPGERSRIDPALDVEALKVLRPRRDVVSLGEVVRWRGRRIVPLQVLPVEAGTAGEARRVLRSGVWEVRFEADPEAGEVGGGVMAREDARFGAVFLNGEVLSDWPRETTAEPPRRSALDEKRISAAGPLLQAEIRLPVTRSRMHRVSGASLRAGGLLTAADVAEDQIRLYQRRYDPLADGGYREIEVPVLLLGDGGTFSDGESFVFWGLRPRDDGPYIDGDGVEQDGCGDPNETWNPAENDPVNAGNIYYLAFRDPDPGRPWARMGSEQMTPAAGSPLDSYRRVDAYEEDEAYALQPINSDADRYRWNSAFDAGVTVPLTLWNPVESALDGEVRVGVMAFSLFQQTMRASLESDAGSTDLGTVVTTNGGNTLIAGGLAGTTLGESGVSLKVVRDGSSMMLGYLDWFEISYRARYEALGDQLLFHCGETVGAVPIEVTGFTREDVHLFDVTDPHRPLEIALDGANVVQDGAGWKLTLTVPQDGTARRFWARAGALDETIAAFPTYRASEVVDAGDPLDRATAPDVLVVTHPDFRTALQPWIDHRIARAGGDLDILTVDSHAVYDRFGGGLKSPDAIRRFVLAALGKPGWAPWALVLVGDASENARNLKAPAGQKDWLPSHHHSWSWGSYPTEMLASDKWYAMSEIIGDYPDDGVNMPEMLVGRFPCNSPDELQAMIGKVIAFENAGDAAWKRRALFLADDEWSSGYDVTSQNTEYDALEAAFQQSLESGAAGWDTLAAGTLETVRIYLKTYLDQYLEPGQTERNDDLFQGYCFTDVTDGALLPQAGQGAAFLLYQGHANDYLLAHEHAVEDIVGITSSRRDIASLANAGKPWIFVGLGCHIATWAKDAAERTSAQTPSLGEKMLLRDGAGAVAVYGSPGYEFLSTNAGLAAEQFRIWMQSPPRSGDPERSRWILGEMLFAPEAAYLSSHLYQLTARRLVAQFALLGDPLMVVDCGPPAIEVALGGELLADGQQIAAVGESNLLSLTVEAWDEAGLDRLAVTDSEGDDLSSAATGGTPDGAPSDQHAVWDLALPVRPFDHEVTIEVYDTGGLPTGAPAGLTLRLPQPFDLYLDGEAVVEGAVAFIEGEPLTFSGQVGTTAWIAADAVLGLTGRNLALSDISVERAGPHELDLEFTAVPDPGKAESDLAVVLEVDGYRTVFTMAAEAEPPSGELVSIPQAFPNPMVDATRFLFRAEADWSSGRIVVFSVAGRRVAEIPVAGGAAGEALVPWDGRDGAGDHLANGVYLYRVELDTAVGAASSDLQRLVVMR